MLRRPWFLRSFMIALALFQRSISMIVIQNRNTPSISRNFIRKRVPSALCSSIQASFESKDDIPNNTNPSNQLTFSIVPASTNPSNKFTKQLLENVLPTELNATDVKLLDANNGGRLTFSVPAPWQHSNSTTNFDGSKWGQYLSPYGVKSLRFVLCECEFPMTLEHKENSNQKTPRAVTNRQDFILETLEANLPQQELPWNVYHDLFGNSPSTTLSEERTSQQPMNLDVSCRRWASSCVISKSEFSSTKMKHALKRLIVQKYDHRKYSRWLDDCEFTLLLFQNKLRLEWTVLVPPRSKRFSEADYLPKPGCKRVEAWMLMKNLEEKVLREVIERNRRIKKESDQQEVVVLDPLCGKATYLVEAATTWKTYPDGEISVSFVGIDASNDQLHDAKMNVDAVADSDEKNDENRKEEWKESSKNDCVLLTKRRSHDKKSTIFLYKGDSRNLSQFQNGSVSAIATCPPFGRQFFALQKEINDGDDGDSPANIKPESDDVLAESYRVWLREWTRILDPQNGRIALLVDVGHQQEALDAITSTGALRLTILREPFRLGRLEATVIVADAIPPNERKHKIQKDSNNPMSSIPLSRFPWEGNAKEARAEWTRLRAASLEGLEPYTNVQRQA